MAYSGWFRSVSGSHRGGRGVPLRRFNQLDHAAVATLLRACLDVDRWVATVLDRRPYRKLDDLFEVARDVAYPLTGAESESALAHRTPRPLIPTSERGDFGLRDQPTPR